MRSMFEKLAGITEEEQSGDLSIGMTAAAGGLGGAALGSVKAIQENTKIKNTENVFDDLGFMRESLRAQDAKAEREKRFFEHMDMPDMDYEPVPEGRNVQVHVERMKPWERLGPRPQHSQIFEAMTHELPAQRRNRLATRIGVGGLIGAAGLGGAAQLINYARDERTASSGSGMMERLAEDEDQNKLSNSKVGLGAASGAVIGGSMAGARVYRNEKKFNDRVNQSVKDTYHDAKDKHIRYQYSKAQADAIRNNPADNKAGAPSRIRQALERRDSYFHPDELELVNDGFMNDSRKLRGADYDALLDQTFGIYRDKPHLNLIPMKIDSNHLIPRMGIGAAIGAVGLGAAAGLAHHHGKREQTAFEASDMMERLAYSDKVDTSQMSTSDKVLSTAVPIAGGVMGAALGARWKHKSLKPDMLSEYKAMELMESNRIKALGLGGFVGGAAVTSPLRPKKKKKEDLDKAAHVLSEAMERYASDKENDGNVAVELGAAGAGGVGLANAKDMITGRKTLYHGTSVDNANSIKANGFVPSDGLSGASGLSTSQDYINQSKGKTHFTSSSPIAHYFANYVGAGKHDQAETMRKNLTEGYETELAANPKNTKWLDETKGKIDALDANMEQLKQNRKGQVLKVNVPYASYAKMEADPHILGEGALPHALGGRLLASTTEDAIDSKYVKGAPDALNFKQQMSEAAQHFPDYIKNHPGRFGSGLALLGGGVGGLGYAGKKLTDRVNEHRTEGESSARE